MKTSTEHETTYELDPQLRQALGNNREALNELFARYRGQLYNRALVVLGNPEDAEDALQEAFLSAFRNLHHFKGRCKLATWLNRIVINAALMQLRRRRPEVMSIDAKLNEDGQERAITFSDPGLNPEEACLRRERQAILRRRIRELTSRYRRALWLRDIKGMTGKEAARILGLSEGTLKSQLGRARLKLKNNIAASPARRSVQESRRCVPITEYFPSLQFAEKLSQPAA